MISAFPKILFESRGLLSEAMAVMLEDRGSSITIDEHDPRWLTLRAKLSYTTTDIRSPKPRGPCFHRSEQIGEAQCPTCQGVVMLKTFACTIHAHCTVARPVEGIACCVGCKDYRPRDE